MSTSIPLAEVHTHNQNRTIRAENESFTYHIINPDDDNPTRVNIRNDTKIAEKQHKIRDPNADAAPADHIHTVTIEDGHITNCTCPDYKYRCAEFNTTLDQMVTYDRLTEAEADEARKLCKHAQGVKHGFLNHHHQ